MTNNDNKLYLIFYYLQIKNLYEKEWTEYAKK